MWTSLFGGGSTPESWIDLVSMDQLEEIDQRSSTAPVAIFKHSMRCSRSAFAFERLAGEFGASETPIELFYLDLLAHRDISNAIAERWKVHHQSPQLIIIENGKAIHHSSHESIDLKKSLGSFNS